MEIGSYLNFIYAQELGDLPIWMNSSGRNGIDFNKILPMPFEGINDHSHEEYLNWRFENWGTTCDPSPFFYGDRFSIFISREGAPIPVIKALAAKYPEITFYYCYVDMGNGCVMSFIYRNGKQVEMDFL